MHERSKQHEANSQTYGEYAPIRLPKDFPVTKPHHVTRTVENAIRAHLHECFEIGYCHAGNGIFLIGDKMLHCGPGDAVAIRQGELHVLLSPQDSSTRWSFVNLDPLGLLAGELRDLGDADTSCLGSKGFCNLLTHDEHPELCSLIKDISDELDADSPGRKHAVMALVWALLVKLRRLAEKGASPEEPEDARLFDKLDQLRPAMRLIADNFSKEISVKALARLCRTSEPNFRRLFRRCLGSAPRDYILRLRLEVAKSLLSHSNLPVLDLSLKAGFPSLSNFNRQFKRFAGEAPRDFRRRTRKLS